MSTDLQPFLALLPATSESLLPTFGRFHILVVHFPIALLFMAALAEAVHALKSSSGRSPTAFACLGVGALGAVIAAASGWIHADVEPLGSSVEELLFRHRWLGVATAAVSALAFLLLAFAPQRGGLRKLYRGLLALSVVLVGVGAHYGGSLVYGPDYLFGYEEPPSLKISLPTPPDIFPGSQLIPGGTPEPEPAAAAIDFDSQVRPLLERSCYECHGSRRQKAGLRLDVSERSLVSDEADLVIVPGDAEASRLYQRVILPAEHEDVMPAKGDLLTVAEQAVLRKWIEAGAEWTSASGQ